MFEIPLDVACKIFPEIQELVNQSFIETCDKIVTEDQKKMLNIDNLKKLAESRVFSDNTGGEVYDWCGGNYDDAFNMGSNDGETQLARQILADLGEKYE